MQKLKALKALNAPAFKFNMFCLEKMEPLLKQLEKAGVDAPRYPQVASNLHRPRHRIPSLDRQHPIPQYQLPRAHTATQEILLGWE